MLEAQMFLLQDLGSACEIRVAYDNEPLFDSQDDTSSYFDSLACFERWLAARRDDRAIVSVTMRTTVDLEDVLPGYFRIDGFVGATMQYDGAVLIVDVTDPKTLGDAYNKAFQVTKPVYDADDMAEADAIVAEGRADVPTSRARMSDDLLS